MSYCDSCDITYEEKYCPLCAAREEIIRLTKELEEIK